MAPSMPASYSCVTVASVLAIGCVAAGHPTRVPPSCGVVHLREVLHVRTRDVRLRHDEVLRDRLPLERLHRLAHCVVADLYRDRREVRVDVRLRHDLQPRVKQIKAWTGDTANA